VSRCAETKGTIQLKVSLMRAVLDIVKERQCKQKAESEIQISDPLSKEQSVTNAILIHELTLIAERLQKTACGRRVHGKISADDNE
jgi:hypothetical protein